MFKKTIATFALIAAIATVALPTSQAQAAGGRNAAFAIGAVTGLAVGAIAHDVAYRNGHRNYRPNRHHRVRHSGRPAPWTRAWYRYCDARYRSFNPRTGYFRGYDGRRHFCR
ncbi:BA14K family protein [Cohaesibacter celericrescens]|uniref:Lectin-like protein BA14k n=1 Tax=Cohaesibacter celericrescens TaxID=2067669 RepID=A0A2N5XS77_9HYPH|nr:BA14K family protein [Cohaesibacter celericrescens]PLW77268.1 BA14K family protein [Cohaesibacter celericrescens]